MIFNVDKQICEDKGVNVITPDKNIMNISPGYGTNTLPGCVRLKDIVNFKSEALIMGDEGVYLHDDGEGYLRVEDDMIGYFSTQTGYKLKSIKGIMVDIPKKSIMNTYYDSMYFLGNGEDVLIVYLDGFGYHQYINSIQKRHGLFLKGLPAADKASTVYKPVTNSGFAAMITGKSPAENGIYSRKQKDMKVTSIFGQAKIMGKKALLVEGNIKILNTEVEPVLNVGRDASQNCDDEVLKCALESIDNGYNLMLVHFHGIDDSGHTYGSLSEKTMDAVKTADEYLSELISRWHGMAILTSDHGMHTSSEGGIHGSFRYEDMIVPYIITEGGRKHEN